MRYSKLWKGLQRGIAEVGFFNEFFGFAAWNIGHCADKQNK
jgi:hypothetical protein